MHLLLSKHEAPTMRPPPLKAKRKEKLLYQCQYTRIIHAESLQHNQSPLWLHKPTIPAGYLKQRDYIRSNLLWWMSKYINRHYIKQTQVGDNLKRDQLWRKIKADRWGKKWKRTPTNTLHVNKNMDKRILSREKKGVGHENSKFVEERASEKAFDRKWYHDSGFSSSWG
jgi:hypothetical protein